MPSIYTGHEGFDFWKDEFSIKIQELEAAFHALPPSQKQKQQQQQQQQRPQHHEAILAADTDTLVQQAADRLTNLLAEVKSVSTRDHPALKQDLTDIYDACQRQFQTYQTLNDQKDLFRQRPPTTQQQQQQQRHRATTPSNTSSSSTKPSSTTTTSPSASSLLWEGSSSPRSMTSSRRTHDGVQANTQGRVAKQNAQLHAALRSLKESEEIAYGISGELRGQRDTLEHTKRSMHSMTDMTQQAKGLLNSMNKKWWMKW
jgi:small-conductance mechanosensitive channel